MRTLGLPIFSRFGDLAPVALRLGVGFNFIWFGSKKLSRGVDSFAATLADLGVLAPSLFAWLVTIAELVGGTLIVLGLLTRVTTLPLIATMIGSIFLVKADLGMPDAGIDIALLAGLAALLFAGPGRFSVDRLVGIEPGETLSTSGVRAEHSSPGA